MRGVGLTRSAGKVKERSNGGKGEHEGKGGGVGRRGAQQIENLVMDEAQETHREDMRKLVEMMQKEEEEQEAREDEERREREAREDKDGAQEARAQEAREEERRAQRRRGKRRGERRRREKKKVSAQEEQERETETQEGSEQEEGTTTQEECVEDKKEVNSMHEGNDVSNRHDMAERCLVGRMKSGPHLRTARGRRRVWRAATRAARETRETERVAVGEKEKWEQGTMEKKESNSLHVVFHFPTASTTTTPTAVAATTAAAVAATRLQKRADHRCPPAERAGYQG